MKRPPLYSRSDSTRRRADGTSPGRPGEPEGGAGEGERAAERGVGLGAPAGWNRGTALMALGGAAVLIVLLVAAFRSDTPHLTQRDIDRAVLYSLENQPRPASLESEAYRVIGPSIVQVRSLDIDDDELEAGGDIFEPGSEESERRRNGTGVGTGVVIVDDGTILTNLHVVIGIERLGVVFSDGTESPARIISVRPEHDLAVIQADLLPDDLFPATLQSTADLRVGDRVIAVGFPFGIGPSLSSGVVSGLRREYRTPEGDRLLSNLIQFDAAANPGNSGGPLVTVDGFVVGIVTAILNPNNQRSFVGIGFAVPIEEAAEAVGSSPF
ncbi:MAG: peptidase S1 [Gemmatimonadales bacterium]|nr:MAG: peptidase S1 [Gemmatimonadales bacterium]